MVSIIIINYNTFQLTADCIRSVIEHTVCTHEIIVVDNASTECDSNELKRLFPAIKLVMNTVNYGFAKGNNKGIEAATGDIILLLNSDTLLINDAIDRAYEKIRFDKNIGALSAQLISTDGTLQQCSYYWTNLGRLIGCTFKLHIIFPFFRNKQPDMTTEHEAEYLWGTFFMFPASILNIFKDGKLSETFFMYSEDAEWSYYIRKAGYKLLYYPQARILHYGAASSKSTDADKWLNGFHNEYQLLRIIKGRYYTNIYYSFLALFYFSSFKKLLLHRGTYILKYIFKNNVGRAKLIPPTFRIGQ